MQQLDDRVVNMYKSIGMILRKYRSGKLPKAFKIIPALNNWEQVGISMERGGIVVGQNSIRYFYRTISRIFRTTFIRFFCVSFVNLFLLLFCGVLENASA